MQETPAGNKIRNNTTEPETNITGLTTHYDLVGPIESIILNFTLHAEQAMLLKPEKISHL